MERYENLCFVKGHGRTRTLLLQTFHPSWWGMREAPAEGNTQPWLKNAITVSE